METKPLVSILMGSDSDLEIMNESAKALDLFAIPYEIDICSAHRSPARTSQFARQAAARGIRVIIAGAGGAAHLAGVIAAETILPVIAVPIAATSLGGIDALLAMVQMPAGIPTNSPAIHVLTYGVRKRACTFENAFGSSPSRDIANHMRACPY